MNKPFPVIVAPSILASNYGRLHDEVRRAEQAGADWLHLDIMDGHFVDNISFGPAFAGFVAEAATVPLDVHLMISRPDHFFERFLPAASSISVHVEADHDVPATLRAIRAMGCMAGLALNPATPFEAVQPMLGEIDLLLVMTVIPGFGGQAFMPETLSKVRQAAAEREKRGYAFHIEVDGGIDRTTSAHARQEGANVLVAGSSTFRAADMAAAVAAVRGAGED